MTGSALVMTRLSRVAMNIGSDAASSARGRGDTSRFRAVADAGSVELGQGCGHGVSKYASDDN
jgi:hypothetical protein